jgi:hypothetical protein
MVLYTGILMGSAWCKKMNLAMAEASSRYSGRTVNKIYSTDSEVDIYRLEGGQVRTIMALFVICAAHKSLDLPEKIFDLFQKFNELNDHLSRHEFAEPDIDALADCIFSFKTDFVSCFPPPKFSYAWPNFDSCIL